MLLFFNYFTIISSCSLIIHYDTPSEKMNLQEKSTNMNEFQLKKQLQLLHSSKYNIENWASLLEQHGHTFKTHSLNLCKETATAIIHYYRQHALNWKNAVTEMDQSLLNQLEHDIQQLIDKEFTDKPVFVRLSSRSPKDSTLFDGKRLKCCDRMKDILFDKLMTLYSSSDYNDLSSPLMQNKEYCALWESVKQAMKVYSADECMELLCNSERVFLDLLLALEFEEYYSIKVIVREWTDELDYAYEFRGFAYNNELTALSQYDPTCYYEELVSQKLIIQNKIQTFFNQEIKHLMEKQIDHINSESKDTKSDTNYVIDFGVLHDGTVVVIELNAFQDYDRMIDCTGSACFSWSADKDIIQGLLPFEFRLVNDPPFTDMEKQVCPDWYNIIQSISNCAHSEINIQSNRLKRNIVLYAISFIGGIHLLNYYSH
jgi:phosphopantetheine adenylyltransferase